MVSLRTLYWQLLVLLLLSTRAAADGIEAAGTVLLYAMPASAAALTLTHRDWEGTWEFAASFAVEGVTVLALKNSVYETRPDGQGHQSLPSGHAAVTFASAEFLRERYGWYYGAPAYALASFTAYSRVESRNHYWHDVIAGAGIGILSSWLFTTSYKDWELQPVTDGKSASLTLLRRW
jgi:membrane-associated phospholipid phosphatase